MGILTLKFDNIDDPVEILLDDGINTDFFLNNLKSFARPADRVYYAESRENSIKNFLAKAQRAKELFNFNWDLETLSQDNFNQWHRDIETFDLSKHPPWSQEKGDFFIDLHQDLHKAESTNAPPSRPGVQIKWFENSVPWPATPTFVSDLDLVAGDIIADYPHVGKDPRTCLKQSDIENLQQCCKLADACPPGFIICLTKLNFSNDSQINQRKQQQKNELVDWYQKNAKELEPLFTQKQMLQYDGKYRIGRLKNLEQISLLRTADLTSVTIV